MKRVPGVMALLSNTNLQRSTGWVVGRERSMRRVVGRAQATGNVRHGCTRGDMQTCTQASSCPSQKHCPRSHKPNTDSPSTKRKAATATRKRGKHRRGPVCMTLCRDVPTYFSPTPAASMALFRVWADLYLDRALYSNDRSALPSATLDQAAHVSTMGT
jgi:hypothetical protein